jgi:CAAX prenyl protease-like protein
LLRRLPQNLEDLHVLLQCLQQNMDVRPARNTGRLRGARVIVGFMQTARPEALTAKPGAWVELALTLPVFLGYHLGVVFLDVRNASDLVTGQLLGLAHGDKLVYLGITAAIGVALVAVFAVIGRGTTFSWRKLGQIGFEGTVYAIAMTAATSWILHKLPLGPKGIDGPAAGLVMSLGAGFYEELAFRAVLFGLGAKLLVMLLVRQRVTMVGAAPVPSVRALVVIAVWAVASAGLFSATHYVGALGDSFELRSFVARAVLGLALTLVYATRGFAAAVWTHALYDAWVLAL